MKRRDEGYVLFGIVIGLVILGIGMTAAVPLWQKVMQREREKELIFRGYQYMQAIELYQRKFPGAYPPSVDVLVEQKFLRKAYKDPFAEDEKGELRIIRQLSPELQQAAQQQMQQAARASGINNLNRSQAQLRTPGQPTPGAPGSTRQPTGGQFQSTLGRTATGGSDQSMGGIVGVASSSDEETFYKVPGKEKYKDWLFVYGAQPGQVGQGAQIRVQPGQVGQQAQAGMSPFQGLPPPPGLTAFRFGSAPAGGGQQAPPPGLPGQPGTGTNPSQQPGFRQPGARQPQQRQPQRQP